MRWLTAHSMYFLVLGELGIPGLVVLLVLIIGGIVATLRSRRLCPANPQNDGRTGKPEMSRMLYLLATSMVGFSIAGAFLSVAYYPHIFVLTGILVSARSIAHARQPILRAPGALRGKGGRAQVGRRYP